MYTCSRALFKGCSVFACASVVVESLSRSRADFNFNLKIEANLINARERRENCNILYTFMYIHFALSLSLRRCETFFLKLECVTYNKACDAQSVYIVDGYSGFDNFRIRSSLLK